MDDRICPCVVTHAPASYEINRHHILPQSWGGATVAANLIDICANTHGATHQLLNLYVHAGGEPSWEVRRRYNALAQKLAARAWAQRPSDKPPYTMTHPGDH